MQSVYIYLIAIVANKIINIFTAYLLLVYTFRVNASVYDGAISVDVNFIRPKTVLT